MREHKREHKYVIIVALFLSIALLGSGCLTLLYPPQAKDVTISGVAEPSGGYYELTEDDAFTVRGVLSTNISIMGVHLGSSMEEIIENVGKPDVQTVPTENVMNWEYRESLGLQKIGLLFHFEDGVVTRITFKTSFNSRLRGNTRINNSKEDIYRLFSKPDKIQLLSGFTLYSYYDQGIEVIMDGPRQNGFSLMYPQPEKARENTKGQDVTSDQEIIVSSASSS